MGRSDNDQRHRLAVLAAPVPSVTLPTLTTMDRQMQNARSRQAAIDVEQLPGARTPIHAAML